MKLALVVAMLAGMVGCTKYYVTGYTDFRDGGDCTHPAVVAYAESRLDALDKCHCWDGHSGDPTVWTVDEYENMRNSIGKQFDADCATRLPIPKELQ